MDRRMWNRPPRHKDFTRIGPVAIAVEDLALAV